MRSNKLSIPSILVTAALLMSCGKMNNSGTASTVAPTVIPLPNGTSLAAVTGTNVVPLTINGSTCGTGLHAYPNKPCVSVTVCDNSNNCKTINDILLDTGSYGLRVFSSVLNASPALSLTSVTSGSNSVAECVTYGDGSKQWGPVKVAKVKLGGESAVTVPIQVIDSTYADGGTTAHCTGAMSSPSGSFNGILGLGLFQYDCGNGCAPGIGSANNGSYYACNGSTCSGGTTVLLANQVQNPVALLGTDNNGVIIELPDIDPYGAASVNGYLILGIGTQSNNQPSSDIRTFTADTGFGEFVTTYNGTDHGSFIDSGSNSYAFPNNGSILPNCSTYTGWFCPVNPTKLTAITTGVNGTSGSIDFNILNFETFAADPVAYASKTIAATTGTNLSGLFDWGLPFYFGRNVYHGITGKTSTLGSGPYWGY